MVHFAQSVRPQYCLKRAADDYPQDERCFSINACNCVKSRNAPGKSFQGVSINRGCELFAGAPGKTLFLANKNLKNNNNFDSKFGFKSIILVQNGI
jgi:hypothetical protein